MENQFSTNILPWENLSCDELSAIYQLRAEVFIVEQDCAYQDIDGLDPLAHHLLVKSDSELAAYSRILPRGAAYSDAASIGRIVTRMKFRGMGLASEMIRLSIRHIEEFVESPLIRISAQSHLQDFYARFGFSTFGQEYLEDGIPHIGMMLELPLRP